jgi:hypothetical protein
MRREKNKQSLTIEITTILPCPGSHATMRLIHAMKLSKHQLSEKHRLQEQQGDEAAASSLARNHFNLPPAKKYGAVKLFPFSEVET